MSAADCVVVGGGPAGLAAARTAARHGLRVTLVDDNAALGGQYYRQMPPWLRAPARAGRESAAGRALIAEVQALGVDLRLGAIAWGIFDGRTVAIATAERSEAHRRRDPDPRARAPTIDRCRSPGGRSPAS